MSVVEAGHFSIDVDLDGESMDPSSVITQVSASANAENVNNDTSGSASIPNAVPSSAITGSSSNSQLQASTKGKNFTGAFSLPTFLGVFDNKVINASKYSGSLTIILSSSPKKVSVSQNTEPKYVSQSI